MKITVDGNTEFDQAFKTPDDFIRAMYKDGPAELTAGTQFALDAMVVAGLLFFIGQAIALYHKKTAGNAANKRHQEIMAKLEEIQKHPTTAGLKSVLDISPVPGLIVSEHADDDALVQQSLAKIKTDIPALISPADHGHAVTPTGATKESGR